MKKLKSKFGAYDFYKLSELLNCAKLMYWSLAKKESFFLPLKKRSFKLFSESTVINPE